MIQQPYYTLADLDEEERQVYEEITKSRLQTLEKFKTRYCRSDLELWLKRELRYCRNIIREVADAKELEQNLASVTQLSNCGTPPAIIQPSKWEYVYAVEHSDVFERELDKVKFIEAIRSEAEKTKNKRIKKFADHICDPSKVDAILAALHSRINSDTTGKQLGITIFAAEKAGLITHPGFAVLVTEFGVQPNSGRKSDYAKYYNHASDGKIRSSEYENLVTYFMTI